MPGSKPRLLPYHVVADYEAEEDDRILDSDTTGQMPSRRDACPRSYARNAAGFQADEGPGGHDMVRQDQGGNMDEMIHGWGNANREEEEPSEDFLNDENEPENEESDMQEEWQEAGEFDLNTR